MSAKQGILDQIVSSKRRELVQTKQELPLSRIEALIPGQLPVRDFAAALRGPGVRLIAEVKKASPSKGLLCPDFDPISLAATYARNGASAISVLTESKFFQGSTNYLSAIRAAQSEGDIGVPLLRKDFIFDEYQIYESRCIGADALLLIAAILDDGQMKRLLELSHRLGMKCLVEVHDSDEARRAVDSGAGVIGINNRDLKTFETDLVTTERLRPLIPDDRVVVSESGVDTRADMERLRRCKVQAALVGEALVTAKDIPAKIRQLL